MLTTKKKKRATCLKTSLFHSQLFIFIKYFWEMESELYTLTILLPIFIKGKTLKSQTYKLISY